MLLQPAERAGTRKEVGFAISCSDSPVRRLFLRRATLRVDSVLLQPAERAGTRKGVGFTMSCSDSPVRRLFLCRVTLRVDSVLLQSAERVGKGAGDLLDTLLLPETMSPLF